MSDYPPPRELADGVHWLGDCLIIEHEGTPIHAYSSLYLVAGRQTSLLVDTGHPKDWPVITRQLAELHARGVPGVAYVFPTHAEVPHAANLGRLLDLYPDAVAVGDVRDYHLFFPEVEERLVSRGAGERIDLGGRSVLLLEPAIKDLVSSLWAYDAHAGVLFPSDGFAYMHHHKAGECWRTAEEAPDIPIAEFTALFNAYALYWTRFCEMEPSIDALDYVLAKHPTALIAPGHGSPIADPAATLPKVKEGLRIGSEQVLAGASTAG